MKKKLLVVAGAGASLEFGMPSVKEIDDLFEIWALEHCPLQDCRKHSLYTHLKDLVRSYYEGNKRNRMNVLMSFEHLLHSILVYYAQLADVEWKHFNNKSNAFTRELESLPIIARYGKRIEHANATDLHILHETLIDKLLDYFRGLGRDVTTAKEAEFKKLRQLISCLRQEFDVGVINLNYDNILYTVLPDLETGFDPVSGLFDKRRIFKKDWSFLYHLHGCVHFDMKLINHSMHQIAWNNNLHSTFENNSTGRSGQSTLEGFMHVNSCIITGLDKANQILKEPFLTYYGELVQKAFEADTILFVGYGFGDRHLNQCFNFNRMDFKKRKVVVIDWASKDEDALQFRHDDWTYGLSSAIPYNAHETGDGVRIMPQAAYYFKENKMFDRSTNLDYPLSVWYNGLMDACEHHEKIVAELVS